MRFLGLVNADTKLGLLRHADIVVVPSRYESFGLVAVEAMMFGKPVISTLAGGIPEVVADGETGLLVPPSDVAAMAVAMQRLCADSALRSQLGVAGRARYLACFTDDAMAAQWLSEIRPALARLQGQRFDAGR